MDVTVAPIGPLRQIARTMPLARVAFSHWRGSDPEPHLSRRNPKDKQDKIFRTGSDRTFGDLRVSEYHRVGGCKALHSKLLYFKIGIFEENQDRI